MAGDQENLSETLEESDYYQQMPTAMQTLVDVAIASASAASSSSDHDDDDDDNDDDSDDDDLVQDFQLQCEIKQMKATQARSLLKKFFRDFKARRAGIVKALTTDVENFYALCTPGQGNLCLYGLPDETWEVKLPPMYVPKQFPEPVSGINVVRDGMDKKKWLSVVAMHSDSWLLALTFYFGTRLVSDKEYSSQYYREKLFSLINSLPTIHEVVTGRKSDESAAKSPSSRICPDCMSKRDCGA